MRVLLIGGSGFIGQRVITKLRQRGHEVILFDRGETTSEDKPGFSHIRGNRLEIDKHVKAIMDARPDAAVDFLPWNDADTKRVIKALKGRVEQVVHLSSGDVYRAWGYFLKGGYGDPVPLAEDAPLREDLYPYQGQSPGMADYDKVLAERVILNAHYAEGYPGVIIRLPMVYGPGDRQHRLWEFVKRMQDGRPAILLGTCQAAWLWHRGYVENIAIGIALAAERSLGIGQVYNVGEARTLTMAAWAKAIGETMGWAGQITIVPDQLLPEHLHTPYNYQQHLLLDTTKIRRDLGYKEIVDFKEGLQKAIAWQIENPPEKFDPGRFDYAAEDAVLKQAAGV